MKISKAQFGKPAGSTLVMTLVAIFAMGVVLFSYLTMISQSQKFTQRSQVWNSCIAIAEAGVEEALAHLNENGVVKIGSILGTNKLDSNGWDLQSDKYHIKRGFGDGYYEVYISNVGLKPVVTATGYLPAPATMAQAAGPMMATVGDGFPVAGVLYVSRTIQARCKATGKFTKAIIGKSKVNLNGKYVTVDSYHSFNPFASTYSLTNPTIAGDYDITERRDNGDVAVIEDFKDDLNIHDAKVWGHVATGPDGDLKLNKKVSVGDLAWHAGGNLGVQPGWSTADANFDIPEVPVPFNSPTANVLKDQYVVFNEGTTNAYTNFYNYVFEDGDYKVSKLEKNVLIKGNARIRVSSDINFDDDPKKDDGIDMWEGAYVEIYMEGKNADIRGKKDKKKHPNSDKLGINPDGNCTNFFLYASKKCDNINVKNCDDFHGIIYAPAANIHIKAGSLKYYHMNFHGAVVGFEVSLEKNVSFHYDENIANLAAQRFVVESWREL